MEDTGKTQGEYGIEGRVGVASLGEDAEEDITQRATGSPENHGGNMNRGRIGVAVLLGVHREEITLIIIEVLPGSKDKQIEIGDALFSDDVMIS